MFTVKMSVLQTKIKNKKKKKIGVLWGIYRRTNAAITAPMIITTIVPTVPPTVSGTAFVYV